MSDIRLSFPSQILNVNELWDEKNESKEKTAIMLASITKEEPGEE